jgi:integrase
LRREDADLQKGTAITRAEDNKGNREESIPLHPTVVEHLKKIVADGPLLFPWSEDRKTLWGEFGRIQKAAGIHLPCRQVIHIPKPVTSMASMTCGERLPQ